MWHNLLPHVLDTLPKNQEQTIENPNKVKLIGIPYQGSNLHHPVADLGVVGGVWSNP